MYEMDKNSLKPKVVLAVGAHPDDIEYGIGGTLAKWIEGGTKVYYLICTDGGKGTSDSSITSKKLVKIRREEQLNAAKVLGVEEVVFMDIEDGTLECNLDLKREIAKYIRKTKPDVVYCFDPTFVYSPQYNFVNHTDHRAAGQATLDAVFPLARDHLSFPELLNKGFMPHKVKTILMTNFEHTNYCEDIGDTLSQKLTALREHKSQIENLNSVKDILAKMAKDAGRKAGCALAEAFVRIDLPD